MNKKIKIIFDVALATIVVGGTIYLCNKYIPKMANAINTAHKEAVAKKELEEQLLKDRINTFATKKLDFKTSHNDNDIAKATLSNKNIDTKEDRAYLYGKMMDYRDKILDLNYRDEETFNQMVDELDGILNSAKKLDKESLDAMLFAMHAEDERAAAKAAAKAAEEAEALKHKRELEIIEEKKNKELAVYKAKLEAEQAKFKTVCETMKDAEKKVQANVNVKTDLEV